MRRRFELAAPDPPRRGGSGASGRRTARPEISAQYERHVADFAISSGGWVSQYRSSTVENKETLRRGRWTWEGGGHTEEQGL